MPTANQVANQLLRHADDANISLTPMQLIKLVYLCHGWMLGLYRRPLISDPVEAWAYGPVIRSLYAEVKKFRSSPVSALLDAEETDFDPEEDDIIRQTFEKYGSYTGPELSRLTHIPGSPWSITYKDRERNKVISDDIITDYFATLASTTAK
jgi:uncharacterized phage-associated protein